MGSKLLYKPVGLLLGMASSVLAGALFKQMWKQVSDKEGPPKPGERLRLEGAPGRRGDPGRGLRPRQGGGRPEWGAGLREGDRLVAL